MMTEYVFLDTETTGLDDDDWPRADPEALAAFDPDSKICVMNCGPASGDPRSAAERKLLCDDCEPANPKGGVV